MINLKLQNRHNPTIKTNNKVYILIPLKVYYKEYNLKQNLTKTKSLFILQSLDHCPDDNNSLSDKDY